MLTLNPYLTFDDNCAEAMRFYQEVLKGDLQLMTHADAPPGNEMPGADPTKVMHSCLTFPGGVIMAADAFAGCNTGPAKGFALTLTFDSVDEASATFDALGKDGRIDMPLAETFWATRFGVLTDRFGVQWMVNAGMKMP
ncbi:VOC family protein [Tahibacter amnicola]|uniref:VOC family protein n=1 Tax=Tahibacter amnicola TaxID=2976241 RepID=A0ABY6BJF8_9GAMM|nr:VOC family protein [Tahibacter amnicola]UXI70159.1 VOC family protein [Tahibacter amnicola]